jgi:hypothetical protein
MTWRFVLALTLAAVLGGASSAATPAGEHARLPRESLAESVVNFDCYIAHGQQRKRFVAGGGTSRMGDSNDLLTIRDLLDLVDFLKGIR